MNKNVNEQKCKWNRNVNESRRISKNKIVIRSRKCKIVGWGYKR